LCGTQYLGPSEGRDPFFDRSCPEMMGPGLRRDLKIEESSRALRIFRDLALNNSVSVFSVPPW